LFVLFSCGIIILHPYYTLSFFAHVPVDLEERVTWLVGQIAFIFVGATEPQLLFI
jgi:hypothetical protein